MIRFDLSITLDYDVLSSSDFAFVIQPTETPYQRVTWEKIALQPEVSFEEENCGDPVNRHLRVHAEPGPFRLRYDAIVDLVHHFALPSDLREVPIADLPASVLQYIYPSRYCQSDRLLDVARREFGTMRPGYERVEAIRAWVQARTRFQPGSSHPGTSALDTYECSTGVCRDYAHLMISTHALVDGDHGFDLAQAVFKTNQIGATVRQLDQRIWREFADVAVVNNHAKFHAFAHRLNVSDQPVLAGFGEVMG